MDKVDMAIQRLQTASDMSLAVYEQPLIITDSGGKDSSVLTDLAIKAKIPIEIQHSHTTADAPETVRFVREKFKRLESDGYSCSISFPQYKGKPTSMWSLIPTMLMPPTRRQRYCCVVLKEQAGKDRLIATGVRWAESPGRAGSRGIYEAVTRKKERNIILSNDNDDARQIFERCTLKAKHVANPIVDWSDDEIWDYIHSEHITVNPLYECGFDRVGCIGCPLASRKKRIWEFAQFPKYETLYRMAFDRLVVARKAAGKKYISEAWETGKGIFLWWMEDQNIAGQIDLFDADEEDRRWRD